MMKVKTVAYWLFAAIALYAGASCHPQELPGGAVTVLLSSGLPQTRGAAEIADGQEIQFNAGEPDLILLLFNSSGTLVAKYPDGEHAELMTEPVATAFDMMIRITNALDGSTIPQGTYSIYAVANTAGLWSLTDGVNTISAGSFTSSSIADKTQADALYFTPLFEAETTPKPHLALRTSPNNLLPLSATGSVSVNANGNGTAELRMLRCAAQVVVKFVNNYTEELTLQNFDVTFKNLNTSTGYLFQHSPTDIPAGILYADLVHSGTPVTLEDNTNPSNDVFELSALVFPGVAPPPGEVYTCDISFDVAQVGSSTLSPVSHFAFSDLPVHNNRGEDITSLSRNQKLTITVTISQGQMLSFSFEVDDWDTLTESVTFD